MKFVVSALVFLAASIAVAAPVKAPRTESQKICDGLQDKMDEACAHIVCDSGIKDGTFKDMNDCTSGSDYYEAAQGICDAEPSLEDVVDQYNREHVGAQLECDYR